MRLSHEPHRSGRADGVGDEVAAPLDWRARAIVALVLVFIISFLALILFVVQQSPWNGCP